MTPERRRQINKHMARVARGGHPESWDELYLLLYPFALTYARKRIPDLDEAEDLVQESFLRLWNVRRRYREGADGYSFFSNILRRVIWKHLSRKAEPGSVGSPVSLDTAKMKPATGAALWDGLSAPEREAHVAQLREELGAAIESLPPALRAAAEARVLEGMKNLEAAQQAGCGVPAQKARLKRALAKVRSRLTKFRQCLFGFL